MENHNLSIGKTCRNGPFSMAMLATICTPECDRVWYQDSFAGAMNQLELIIEHGVVTEQ